MNNIIVSVNGRSTTVPHGATVTDLAAQLKLATKIVIVELNGAPLSREEFPTTVLGPGDAIEIVQMVGGG
ncbi:MAG TPA: sulfur carrier protein ThiS [Candidatus Eremiobacteraceae bacterium]